MSTISPRWKRDLIRLMPIRSQFIFSGNVKDVYLDDVGESESSGAGYTLKSFQQILWEALSGCGFSLLVRYNPIDGISLLPGDADRSLAEKELGIKLTTGNMPVALDTLAEILKRVAQNRQHRVAALMDYASRMTINASNPSPAEYKFFATCDMLAREVFPVFHKESGRSLFNPIIWIAFRRNDLPAWFGTQNSRILAQEIEKPSYDQRIEAAKLLLPQFTGYDAASDVDRAGYVRIFADLTDSLTLRDMEDISQICRADKIVLSDIDDAVRSYKTGDQALDNPWSGDGIKKRLKTAERTIRNRVKGQDSAIELAMDILKRSVLGLTAAHRSSSHGCPRGILFLAGPTGVGKTELAKALTESVFGDENAMHRFDMSEFRAEHSDQRLIGAPPGYVGFEGGGELTNAMRARPFSLVLFDEIEKAHERILDKFLQILEDGRLTDGRGETVFFSESIIVFTSNLGIIETDEMGNPRQVVTYGATYEQVKEKVLDAIRNHFIYKLHRPELLNRLGDNIVVFNFIEKPVAEQIFDIMIENVRKRIREEHDAALELTEDVKKILLDKCTANLDNGGRGIGSRLESMLINPLSRALFEVEHFRGKKITVTELKDMGQNYAVTLEVTQKL